jgi:hypothetical protein
VEVKTMLWLEVKNLNVEIDGKKILNGLDLTIEKGEGPCHHGPERLEQVDARLSLQLHFRFEMGAACFGLVSSSPE